jgi:hypothetical protein
MIIKKNSSISIPTSNDLKKHAYTTNIDYHEPLCSWRLRAINYQHSLTLLLKCCMLDTVFHFCDSMWSFWDFLSFVHTHVCIVVGFPVNICLTLSTIYIFIHVSECVGRGPVHCLAREPMMLLRRPWLGVYN